MIYLYSIFYSIYLFFFMDTLLIQPNYWLQAPISSIFLVISTVLYLYNLFIKKKENIEKKYLIMKELTTFIIMLIILMLFVLNLGRKYTNWEVVLQQFLLIGNVYMTGKVYSQYRRKDLFLFVSFIIPSVFLLYYFKESKYPLDGIFNIENIMETKRTRYDYMFNNFNTAGNLLMGVLITSVVFIANAIKKKQKIIIKILKLLMTILIDIPLGIMLINTGSRTSLVALAVFIILGTYFVITNIKIFKAYINIPLKLIIGITLIITISNYLKTNYDKSLIEQNRLQYLEKNIKGLDTNHKKNFGLGIIYNGDFADHDFGFESTQLDNYFVYILMCTGRVGLTIFIICFSMIGIKIYLNMYINKSIESNIIPAVFISHIIASMGESCLLYFTFPLGFIFTTLYIITIDDMYYKLLEIKEIKKN